MINKTNKQNHYGVYKKSSEFARFLYPLLNMSNRIYVGNLLWATSDATLREAFSEYGEVANAAILRDTDTGKFFSCNVII